MSFGSAQTIGPQNNSPARSAGLKLRGKHWAPQGAEGEELVALGLLAGYQAPRPRAAKHIRRATRRVVTHHL